MVNEKPKAEKNDEQKPATETPKDQNDKKQEEELSEEDQQLKNELDMLVERLQESKTELHRSALEHMRTLIRTSTSSMTSVPKPLKFLGPQYTLLTTLHETWPESSDKTLFADILAILSMTYAEEGKRESLRYRLAGSKGEDIGSWGHEFVRHLSTEIINEFNHRVENDIPTDELYDLAFNIVPFFLKHNAEADAVDLLSDIEKIESLPKYVDKTTYERVCLYMLGCITLLPPPDDVQFVKTCRTIYREQEKHAQALTLSIRLGNIDDVKEDLNSCSDPSLKKQLAFLLARQRIYFETEDEEINNCLRNTALPEHFKTLVKELDLLDAKDPEDIYKRHLDPLDKKHIVDSPLASGIVSGFVNAGFGYDKLLAPGETSGKGNHLAKVKDGEGRIAATASLGLINLWDIEKGLQELGAYLESENKYLKAGAHLSLGILGSGVRDESESVYALLIDCIGGDDVEPEVKRSAILGLGLAYAGSAKEDLADSDLQTMIGDETIEIASLAALALGMIFVGTCHGDITSAILQAMMERPDKDLESPWSRFMALGLALLYLGKQEDCDATRETLKAIEHPIGKQAEVLVDSLAYTGTGNVLKVQDMLHICNEHQEVAPSLDQTFAVLGVALIAMGEEIGTEMAVRTLNLLMAYGDSGIRRAVPLALGLLHVSNPQANIIDTLSKYSHDNDDDVAASAIFAMGIIGSGTNHARLAELLRNLATFYHKEAGKLLLVRLSQGLLHMAKGTMTLSPFHTDRQIMSPVAVAGIITSMIAFTDTSSSRDEKWHFNEKWYFLLYSLVTAMYPRFLMTFDENMQHLPATVRVGQAVDVVGQAGRPKTITGFQTHSTPVLIAHAERAELATEEYISAAPVLEGIVILRKNPEYMDEDTE